MNERTKQARTCRQSVAIATPQLLRDVCGPAHVHLQQLERAFADDAVRAESQGGEIVITGQNDACRRAADALEAFLQRIAAGAEASADELASAIRLTQANGPAGTPGEVITGLRKPVMAQTPGQRAYLDTLRNDEFGLVFGVGPAGTGKTFASG